ncbi:hypothetical protein SeMB42_g05368 [Synchytrium endobioticum]|uniref:Uncharacterized protein n=1 Tax=Synchytrium endobioticum TaxID=286115 RepID=A0A507CRW2_9FUNG|nr:hypothetical protein SeMB42_g05368 [Synchytrium endobioticum]
MILKNRSAKPVLEDILRTRGAKKNSIFEDQLQQLREIPRTLINIYTSIMRRRMVTERVVVVKSQQGTDKRLRSWRHWCRVFS